MSLGTPIGAIPDPDLRSLLQSFRADLCYSFNCHQIGSIVTFDPALQTATVQLSVLRVVTDPTRQPPQFIQKAYPILTDCPVFIAAGGTGRLTFPIAAGDSCLVLFNDRDLDNWFATGNTVAPNSARAHDLSDGLVLIGFRNRANKITDYNEDAAELRYAGGILKLADKVAIEAELTDLKTVVQKVIDALTALNGKTGPSYATQIAAAQSEADDFFA